jgi:hypothetical protein
MSNTSIPNLTADQMQQLMMMQQSEQPTNDDDMKEFADKVASQLQDQNSLPSAPLHNLQNMQSLQNVQPMESNNLLDKLPSDLKEPLVVAVLFLVLSHPQVQKQVAVYVPNVTLEDGTLSTTGLLGLSVLAGGLFFGSKYLMKN